GDSSTLMTSQIGLVTSTPPLIGERNLFEAVDSPADSYAPVHPGYPGAALTRIRLNLSFTSFLILWTNVTGDMRPTGHWADRVYVVMSKQPWNVQATYDVDGAGNGSPVGTPSINLGALTSYDPPAPISATGVVMIPPVVGTSLARDARF